jgi:hypothetical protein
MLSRNQNEWRQPKQAHFSLMPNLAKAQQLSTHRVQSCYATAARPHSSRDCNVLYFIRKDLHRHLVCLSFALHRLSGLVCIRPLDCYCNGDCPFRYYLIAYPAWGPTRKLALQPQLGRDA